VALTIKDPAAGEADRAVEALFREARRRRRRLRLLTGAVLAAVGLLAWLVATSIGGPTVTAPRQSGTPGTPKGMRGPKPRIRTVLEILDGKYAPSAPALLGNESGLLTVGASRSAARRASTPGSSGPTTPAADGSPDRPRPASTSPPPSRAWPS
jgi:hypothetical protein